MGLRFRCSPKVYAFSSQSSCYSAVDFRRDEAAVRFSNNACRPSYCEYLGLRNLPPALAVASPFFLGYDSFQVPVTNQTEELGAAFVQCHALSFEIAPKLCFTLVLVQAILVRQADGQIHTYET